MNIFVAKLDYDTQESTLRHVFEAYGEVDSVKIIMNRETGRSKGFGFVEMPDDAQAQEAIAGLNDQELDGRTIVVKKAEPRENNRGGGYNRGGGGYNRGGGGYNRGGGGGYNRGGGGYGGGGGYNRY